MDINVFASRDGLTFGRVGETSWRRVFVSGDPAIGSLLDAQLIAVAEILVGGQRVEAATFYDGDLWARTDQQRVLRQVSR